VVGRWIVVYQAGIAELVDRRLAGRNASLKRVMISMLQRRRREPGTLRHGRRTAALPPKSASCNK